MKCGKNNIEYLYVNKQENYDDTKLAYGISTDVIINGAACTLGYTEEILGPYLLENFGGYITKNYFKDKNIEVLVAGENYGSGSSREVAVVAHRGAGIKLIIAKSFERIFRENMIFDGFYFTSDFSILDKLLSGESVDLSSITERSLSPVYRQIFHSGGLLNYGASLLKQNKVFKKEHNELKKNSMTVCEKIIASKICVESDACNTGFDSVKPGEQYFIKTDYLGFHEYTGGHVGYLYKKYFNESEFSTDQIVRGFCDHFVLLDHPLVPVTTKQKRFVSAQKMARELLEFCSQHKVSVHGPEKELGAGVCHSLVVENYAKPGDVLVLTDSHTCTEGVLNCFSFGGGATSVAFALKFGVIPVTVPKTVRIIINEDTISPYLTTKDIILHIIGMDYFKHCEWKSKPDDTVVFQFGGTALNRFSIEELSVLTNMSVEGGAVTGIIEPNVQMINWLKAKRGLSEKQISEMFVYPDEDANYEKTIIISTSNIPITIATPGDSRNAADIKKYDGTKVNNVVICSCTGASLSDLQKVANIWKGETRNEKVNVIISPSSQSVVDEAEKLGIMKILRDFGAVITESGCGACIGNGPGISEKGFITLSTSNRNFSGRMGPGDVYLVSPVVAAIASITGEITNPDNWNEK